MKIVSVDYGHFIKHRNTARISGEAERMRRGGRGGVASDRGREQLATVIFKLTEGMSGKRKEDTPLQYKRE